MEPIREGASGAAVEDIQERLASLDYEIDAAETDARAFGATTAAAVSRFRVEHELTAGSEVDSATWAVLVDECYQMGDRTLYLRLPSFHGNDVRTLQNCLNILGFSCGEADGCFGVHTEAAVKQFQENVGVFADGMAFQDTFDAIERLHHVWGGKPAAGPHPMGGMGFARAASVLDETHLAITADDPISRNVAGRVWNLASATSDASGVSLVDSPADVTADDSALIILSCDPPKKGSTIANVQVTDIDELPLRIRTAIESCTDVPPVIRIELPCSSDCDGSFTTSDSQTLAVMLLDSICGAFAR
ncbi:MAG: peptidoglycan-binding protein [Atopobiaceae bacterium]|jgi:peptidoglycan hydrolase-like protein with peptidoglycan-binding domain|nr:peptidoglycan-binding protein [Atopobiaceae bacterium]MCI2173973.1 peptidoglycan-binding protein [Atopobiaceae bacterium]MCI2207937.1 peptidoglycan-binding protein [Atopobiaceae bacterium]